MDALTGNSAEAKPKGKPKRYVNQGATPLEFGLSKDAREFKPGDTIEIDLTDEQVDFFRRTGHIRD